MGANPAPAGPIPPQEVDALRQAFALNANDLGVGLYNPTTGEIQLAPLLGAGLRRPLWGTVSLGWAACLGGVPEPVGFLTRQGQLLRALALVLHHCPVGSGSAVGALRGDTAQLQPLVEELDE